MNDKHIGKIAAELGIGTGRVSAAARLLEEGATVPFIARYRKEATGGLDEIQIIAVRDRIAELDALERRRESMLASLAERDLLSPELEKALLDAEKLSVLEDLYLPYRPRRRTRATAAREAGLEPLADAISGGLSPDPEAEASGYINAEAGIDSAEKALAGARDIIAERLSENAEIRGQLRMLFEKEAVLESSVIKKKEKEASKYRDYFDFRQKIMQIPAHRFLAVMRGAEEGYLRWRILPDEDKALGIIRPHCIKGLNKKCAAQIEAALTDAYGRLISGSLENEMRKVASDAAEEHAARVFAGNLRELLMAPPLGRRRLLAVDPGLRTGCKLVCLSAQGDLLEHGVMYPLEPHKKETEAEQILRKMAGRHSIEAVAVGNGTGGREAEAFLNTVFRSSGIPVIMVNESGASVYSASEVARREFPEYDLTVRGAVSIGRRLMDPLSELVKIDPKAIGVGQYQHDVDQKLLKRHLDDVVSSCVNSVGVEVNTASPELLSYVSGLSRKTAEAIVKKREQAGGFRERAEILAVPGIGEKAYQQAAGFLRLRDSRNPLDAGGVHPEQYPVVEKMASDLGVPLEKLCSDPALPDMIEKERYVCEEAGLPTLNDIIAELKKPGRDPRAEFEVSVFAEGIKTMDDLEEGLVLNGVVSNVTAFGAFVDIGVHQDGLVHISEISDSFVRDPADVLRVNQKVRVRVVGVDMERKRISLSMKGV